jgi:hypothetical protein
MARLTPLKGIRCVYEIKTLFRSTTDQRRPATKISHFYADSEACYRVGTLGKLGSQ